MKRLWELGRRRRVSTVKAAIGLFALETIVASCAVSENDIGGTHEETDGGSAGDAAKVTADVDDAGAEADPERCATSDSGCDDVEWYRVDTKHPLGLGLASVWGSGPDDVWAVGAAGSVIHWDGSVWVSVPIDTKLSLQAVHGTGPHDVWVVATANMIFHSNGFASGSAQWTRVTSVWEPPYEFATPGTLNAIWASSPNDVWTIGKHRTYSFDSSFNTIIESAWRTVVTDDGIEWTSISAFDSHNVNSMWGSGPDDVWVVGSKGANSLSFAAHTNGAPVADGSVLAWTEVDTRTFSVLNAVWGSGPGDVWTVGDGGTIRHITAGAKTSSIVESPTTENLRGLWGAGPKDIWAVGENGTFLHYDGTEWRTAKGAFSSKEKRHLYSIWGSGPSDVWAVGDGIVMHYSGPRPGAQGAKP